LLRKAPVSIGRVNRTAATREGEGLHVDAHGRAYEEIERSVDQLRPGGWEVRGDDDKPLLPLPTPESKVPGLTSA